MCQAQPVGTALSSKEYQFQLTIDEWHPKINNQSHYTTGIITLVQCALCAIIIYLEEILLDNACYHTQHWMLATNTVSSEHMCAIVQTHHWGVISGIIMPTRCMIHFPDDLIVSSTIILSMIYSFTCMIQ